MGEREPEAGGDASRDGGGEPLDGLELPDNLQPLDIKDTSVKDLKRLKEMDRLKVLKLRKPAPEQGDEPGEA